MYEALFKNDNGTEFRFGESGGNIFDLDVGNGISVDIGTSQGFSQIGETVETQAVPGRTIPLKGVIFRNVPETKKRLRNIMAPFSSGKLVMEDGKYMRVFVKDSPTFSPKKNDGRFTAQFYAPFPYFFAANNIYVEVGGVTPEFRFPVNYAETHRFGSRSHEKYKNIINTGDVRIPFALEIVVHGESENPIITNLVTFEYLKINGSYESGDVLSVNRDENNVLIASLKKSNGEKLDLISSIDEESTLFELNVGDNMLAFDDNFGGAGLRVGISYSPAEVAWYEA